MQNTAIQAVYDRDAASLKGVGPRTADALRAMGLGTVGELAAHYPRRYEDRRVARLDDARDGDACAVLVRVVTEPALVVAKGMKFVRFKCREVIPDGEGVRDAEAEIDITFFNAPYIKNAIKSGQVYRFYGNLSKNLLRGQMANPKYEPWAANLRGLYPVYRKPLSMTQNVVRSAVAAAVAEVLPHAEAMDILPAWLREKYSLCHAAYALAQVHSPEDDHALELARKRLAFEEMFLYFLGLCLFKKRRSGEAARAVAGCDPEAFYTLLPFEPTPAQRRVVGEIAADMAKGEPMSRLVQGDVGSGKTAVAAAAVYFAAKDGGQASLMAPTEILANQHYEWMSKILEPAGIKTVLLTGSMPVAAKRKILEQIESGQADFVIGTHAILSKGVTFRDLALSITDEQHRFGVAQRASQAEKANGAAPHALVMSATPIPRTLALIMYGDLDVSVIDTLPPGRMKVDTYLVGEEMRPRINKFIRRIVEEGGQVFIVCQLIGDDENDGESEIEAKSELKSVTEYYKKLSAEVFPDIPMALLHGRMKPKDKDACMESFAAGRTKILVSTIVIEVGVNIPDAALMVVENAERLGLSQLHQLRGRVGRGQRRSYCVLFQGGGNEDTVRRLEVMTQTNDGFEIARRDIEMRGPGDLFGQRQSGLAGFAVADLTADVATMQLCAAEARALIAADPELTSPENRGLADAVSRLFSDREIAFN